MLADLGLVLGLELGLLELEFNRAGAWLHSYIYGGLGLGMASRSYIYGASARARGV